MMMVVMVVTMKMLLMIMTLKKVGDIKSKEGRI